MAEEYRVEFAITKNRSYFFPKWRKRSKTFESFESAKKSIENNRRGMLIKSPMHKDTQILTYELPCNHMYFKIKLVKKNLLQKIITFKF